MPADIEEYREEIEALLTVLETSGPRILRSMESTIEAISEIHAMLESGNYGRQTLARLAGEGAERE